MTEEDFATPAQAYRAYFEPAIFEDTRDVVEIRREGDRVVVPMQANIAVAS